MIFAMLFLSGVTAQNGNGNGNGRAPIVTGDAAAAIDDTWIVQTTPNVPTEGVRGQIRSHVNSRFRERYPGPANDGVTIENDIIYNYESDAIYGFTVTFAARANKKGKIIPVSEKKLYHQLAVETLSEISGVVNIEQDQRVEAWGHPFNAMAKPVRPPPPPPPPPGTSLPESPVVQTYNVGSIWGLDRLDSRTKTFNQQLGVPATGAGVTVYVIDTGIRVTHEQFQKTVGGSRASWGWSAVGETTDGNGHGTHCAGTIGGKSTGVAREANLVAVQVLSSSGSGSTSGCIAGVNWVANNAVKPAVASMSLGGSLSSTFNSAVQNAVNVKGIPFAIAAGNSDGDACKYSPASAPDAITVGATTNGDAIASYSNWGTCVDINAPGSSIYSSWIGSDSAYNTISGTSMATPHVAGVTALYMQLHPLALPAKVIKDLKCWATANALTNIKNGTPNKLLYSKVGYDSPSTVTQCYV